MKRFKFLVIEQGITEYDPEYYNCDGFEFVGVTPLYYSPGTFQSNKYLLFKHLESGEVIKGEMIYNNHPMWNYDERV